MNHSFTPIIGINKCAICTYDERAHSDLAQCDCCPNIGPVQIYSTMLMCETCIAREKEHESRSDERLTLHKIRENALNRAIAEARQINDSILVRTDIFNTETTSITNLKKVIDEDASISNKPYALAEELLRQFNHFKQVIFERNQEIVEANNKQKAIQVYLNSLANQLRAEEREKLKIQDINYKPAAPVKPRLIKTGRGKFDKIELRKYATELGIGEFILQAFVVQKGITVEQAANILRRSIAQAKLESGASSDG